MMNCSGHLLSTAQIESALVEHAAIAEAAVVSQPHEVKGEVPYCFVTLKNVSENVEILDLKRFFENDSYLECFRNVLWRAVYIIVSRYSNSWSV